MAPSPLGFDLPVVDLTHPAFAVPDDPAGFEALKAEYVWFTNRQRRTPQFVVNAFLWLAALNSPLCRSFARPEKSFLGGLSTYIMKLGPKNLVPPVNSVFDRYICSTSPVRSLLLRLKQTATLTAECLEPLLAADPGSPLVMLNIGGGPAADSFNALILLVRRSPSLLDRPIRIIVLDGDPQGPEFGKSALAALQTDGQPLAGLDISLEHLTYNWSDTAR